MTKHQYFIISVNQEGVAHSEGPFTFVEVHEETKLDLLRYNEFTQVIELSIGGSGVADNDFEITSIDPLSYFKGKRGPG